MAEVTINYKSEEGYGPAKYKGNITIESKPPLIIDIPSTQGKAVKYSVPKEAVFHIRAYSLNPRASKPDDFLDSNQPCDFVLKNNQIATVTAQVAGDMEYTDCKVEIK
ncbi:hypothetical protein BH10PSE19_BH10PSE19_20580 [soil metagenome]